MKKYWTNIEILKVIESHIAKDKSGADRDCAYNEALKQLWREFHIHKKASPYPFEEGDTYFTIENGEVVESCWDEVSEEMHNDNPKRRYFIAAIDAIEAIRKAEAVAEYENTKRESALWREKAENGEHPGRGFCLNQAKLWESRAAIAKAEGRAE